MLYRLDGMGDGETVEIDAWGLVDVRGGAEDMPGASTDNSRVACGVYEAGGAIAFEIGKVGGEGVKTAEMDDWSEGGAELGSPDLQGLVPDIREVEDTTYEPVFAFTFEMEGV